MKINCKGALVDLSTPKVIGILNLTPDSFFAGARYSSDKTLLDSAQQMLNDGAQFLDLGAYSSRPGADFISQDEELFRLMPAVELLVKNFPDVLLSIDTFRADVAKKAVEAGAAIVNDISAGALDDAMISTVGKLKVPYIMMHMRGTPQTMQSLTQYDDVVKEMLFYFSGKIELARAAQINDLIVDPGFGFAKTIAQNYEVFQKLELFKSLELPMLIGVSRKSMIYKPLESSAKEALNGTSVLNTIALTKGAKILRVHDVREAVEAVKLYQLANNLPNSY